MSGNHYVFVDYENVHQVDLSVVGKENVFFTLLLGARQTKLEVSLVEKLIKHSASVELHRLASSGKNALDFAIAYYLGRAASADSNATFHIISKDTGFNPLIEHLRSRNLKVQRHEAYSTLPFVHTKVQAKPNSNDLFNRVLERLKKNANSRPRRKKTLAAHIRTMAEKNATDQSIERVIKRLASSGHLSINDKDVVTYSL